MRHVVVTLSFCGLNTRHFRVLASEGSPEAWKLGDHPQRWIQEPLMVRDGDGRPQEDPVAVHCFCVCSGSVLLGDLGVNSSM